MPTEAEVEVGIKIGPWVLGKIVKGEGLQPPEILEEVPKIPKQQMFTDITIILDRSGSMGSIREETVNGINDSMREIDKVPGDGCWTLVTFDEPASAMGAKEQFPHYVFSQADAWHRPFLELQNYVPRGGTNLVDAVYIAVSHLKARIKELSKEERARRKVLVSIMTDGEHNTGGRYTGDDLKKLIAGCIAAGWDFLYLGANQDAWTVGNAYGVCTTHTDADGVAVASAGTSPFFGGVAANWHSDPAGLKQMCHASTFATRDWKAEGNQSVQDLQGSGLPDDHKNINVLDDGHKVTN